MKRTLGFAVLIFFGFILGVIFVGVHVTAGGQQPTLATENGDVNGDGLRDISDAVSLLSWLFQGGTAPVAVADSPEIVAQVAELESGLNDLRDVVGTLQKETAPVDHDHSELASLNDRVSELESLSREVTVRVRASERQTIPYATPTAVVFDVEEWDADAMHDTEHPTRLTARESGSYVIYGNVVWPGWPDGIRRLSIRLNGSDILSTALDEFTGGPASVGRSGLQVTTHYILNQGDYVELVAEQDAVNGSSNLNLHVSSQRFGLVKIPSKVEE